MRSSALAGLAADSAVLRYAAGRLTQIKNYELKNYACDSDSKLNFESGERIRNFEPTTICMIKYTNQFLTKLEDLIAESDYMLRYEKGNFKAGYCLLKEQKIMIVNKFFTMEGKINALLDILKTVPLDTAKFSEKNVKLYEELSKAEVSI